MFHAKLSYEQEQELTKQLLDTLDGQWDRILPMVIPELQDAIAAGHRRHVDCILPGHGGPKDFRICNNFSETGCCICTCTASSPIRGGIDLVQRVRSVDFKTARNLLLDATGRFRDYAPVSAPAYQPRPVRQVDHEALKRESDATKSAIVRIWNETVSLKDDAAKPALRWFHGRGLLPLKWPLADVRFHPALRYTDGDTYLGEFPAIVSMIRDNEGRSKTIHRTYITKDGRKPAEIPAGMTRKLFAVPNDLTASGSSVRLDEPTNCLMLAEGIETALTARTLTGLPTWACLSKDLLRRIEIPESVRYITIWADKDRSDAGQQAAAELVERLLLEGRRAIAMLPPGDIPDGAKSLDWNDLIISRGAQPLRDDFQFRQWHKRLQSILAEDAGTSTVAPGPSEDEIFANAFVS